MRLLSMILVLAPVLCLAEEKHSTTVNTSNTVIEGKLTKKQLLNDHFLGKLMEKIDALDKAGGQEEQDKTTVIIHVEDK